MDYDLNKVAMILLGMMTLIGIVTYIGFSQSTYADYTYTTTANTTNLTINGATQQEHNITLSAIDTSIPSETGTKTLTAIIDNKNDTDDFDVDVFLNGVKLGTITATKDTATTEIFTGVAFTSNAENQLLYNSTNENSELIVDSSSAYYPTGTTNTGITNFTNLLAGVVITLVVVLFMFSAIMKGIK